MFRELITTPIDPIPVQYVRTLQRLNNEPDYSLTCLGVALLKPRINGYCGIKGTYRSFESEATCVTDFLSDWYPIVDNYPMFCYYRYSQPAEDDKDLKEKLEENGFEIKESVGALIWKKANLKCTAAFHKEKNCAIVMMNSQDIKFYRMIISLISLLWPRLFEEKPMTQEDFDLVRSLTKTDRDMFVQKIQESVKPYVLEFRKLMLENLLRSMHDTKIAVALQNVNNQRSQINDMEQRIAEYYDQLKNYIAMYEGMKATETYDGPEKEFVEYLASNKAIHNFQIDGNRITFSVATLLNNYNADSWAAFLRRGSILDGMYGGVALLDVFNERNNRRILLNSIFSETPEFAIKIAGNYTLDLNNSYVTTSKTYDYNNADPIFKTYLPNPHLKRFGCLGGYDLKVSKAIRDRNFIGAIEMCCASAGSVNLDETEQTFRPFLGWLLSSREKVLHRRDGVDMTPEEALVYLVDKEQ